MAAVLKRSFLGIDIGKEAVCAVLCQTQRGEERIVAAHRAVRGGQRTEADLLAEVLGPVLAHDGALAAACAVALPAHEFVFRPLTAPFAEDRKLRQVLPLELEPSLVAAAEEMVFDYRRLEPGPSPRILAVALEKGRLTGLLETLAGLHLDPEWVTVAGICPALCLMAEPPADAPQGATVVAAADGRLLAVRDLTVSPGTEDAPGPLGAMLHQTLQAVAAADGGAVHPERIRITGYGPQSAAGEARLAQALGLPVERVDLSAGRRPVAKPAYEWDPGAMNGALALALCARRGDTGFNLRQGDFAVKKFWTRYRPQLRRTAVLAAAALLLGAAQMAHGIHLKQGRIQRIDGEIEALFRAARPEVDRLVDPVSQMRAAIAELEDATRIPGGQEARPRAIDILAALSREIPAELDVEITRLVIGTDNLTLTGHTAAFNAVDEIKTRLERNPVLREVTIAAANIDNRSNRVRFTINVARLEAVPWPSS